MRIRKNVNALNDDTLLWYSRAVEAMKKKDISDPTSWWYQGAVHGFGLDKTYPLTQGKPWTEYSVWEQATGFPPSKKLINSDYWQQCQHGTWYFLPWHRMYLYYFEAIVAQTIIELGGPDNWTLPYWNYCDADNMNLSTEQQEQALKLPAKFGTPHQAAKDYPGLWMEERAQFGVSSAGDASCSVAMALPEFTTPVALHSFGGIRTGFSHNPIAFGQLESHPHNIVHVDINGAMGDPNTAALDPIFWLHHANIDRIWQCWIDQGRENTHEPAWLNQAFNFHDAHGQPVSSQVKDVLQTQTLGYTYSTNYPTIESKHVAAQDNAKLIATPSLANTMYDIIAATTKAFKLESGVVTSNLEFLPAEQKAASALSFATSPNQNPKHVIIRLDNVTGKGGVAPISLYVKSTTSSERIFVGRLGLFGLTQASIPSVRHAGNGLSLELDATEAINTLRQHPEWEMDSLQIELEPIRSLGDVEVTVGRISLHVEM